MGKFSLSARQQTGCLLKISKKGNNTRPGTRLTSLHHAMPYVATPHRISPRLASPHRASRHVSPRHTSHSAAHLITPCLFHLTSPCVASPQNPSLSPQHKSNSSCYTPCFVSPPILSHSISPYASSHVLFRHTSCFTSRFATHLATRLDTLRLAIHLKRTAF